VYQKLKMVG